MRRSVFAQSRARILGSLCSGLILTGVAGRDQTTYSQVYVGPDSPLQIRLARLRFRQNPSSTYFTLLLFFDKEMYCKCYTWIGLVTRTAGTPRTARATKANCTRDSTCKANRIVSLSLVVVLLFANLLCLLELLAKLRTTIAHFSGVVYLFFLCFSFARTEAEFQYCKAAKKLELTRTEVFALTQQFEASLKRIEVSLY